MAALAPRDDAALAAEQNLLRYIPLDKVLVRPAPSTTRAELSTLERAARASGVDIEIAGSSALADDELARGVGSSGAQRLRALGPISDSLARACHDAGITIDDTAVTASSFVELPRWHREQAISRTMHRHGRVSRV
jgi:RHH-type proline utilization regulon transcriptional repressor/proline dehydrogenase/delta 1-pyrroline-5-carboxylate dehydrogenase